MDAGSVSFSSPPPNSILQEARLLNSDLGRHSVKSNFSTRLAGRFYSNGSLERHAHRRSSLLRMIDRKRDLERELQLEERRVELLLDRLRETEKARENAYALISTIERGVLQFQSVVRRRQAMTLFHSMQHELRMRKLVAQVFQCRYRGWKGRSRAESKREYLRQKRRDESLLTIQTFTRGRIQRIHYLDLLAERKRVLSNRSATAIQAVMRGKLLRMLYLAELSRRHDGARNIQRMWRGSNGRTIANKLRDEMLRQQVVEEKPKRIPLHLRRYSSYGSSNNNHETKRRTSLTTNRTKKREVIARRRNSDVMVNMTDHRRLSTFTIPKSVISAADEPENDSIATTLTSLTNETGATEISSKQPIRHRATPSSPSLRNPQRVLAHDRMRIGTSATQDEVGTRRIALDRRKNNTCGIPAPLQKSSLHSATASESKSSRPLRKSSMHSCADSASKPSLQQRKSSLHSCKESVPKPPKPPRNSSLHSCKDSVSKSSIPPRKSSLHSSKDSVIKPPIPRVRHKREQADPAKTCVSRTDAASHTEVLAVPQITSQSLIDESMKATVIISAEALLLVQEVLREGSRIVQSTIEECRKTTVYDE